MSDAKRQAAYRVGFTKEDFAVSHTDSAFWHKLASVESKGRLGVECALIVEEELAEKGLLDVAIAEDELSVWSGLDRFEQLGGEILQTADPHNDWEQRSGHGADATVVSAYAGGTAPPGGESDAHFRSTQAAMQQSVRDRDELSQGLIPRVVELLEAQRGSKTEVIARIERIEDRIARVQQQQQRLLLLQVCARPIVAGICLPSPNARTHAFAHTSACHSVTL